MPNLLIQWLENLNGTTWIILAVGLLIFELLTGTSYILWISAAALLVGTLAFMLPLTWEVQFLLFFVIATALLIFGHIYVRPKIHGTAPSTLNNRAQALIGQRVKVITHFEVGQGRVQVGDSPWRAQSDEKNFKIGDTPVIIDVKGTTLIVQTQPVEELPTESQA